MVGQGDGYAFAQQPRAVSGRSTSAGGAKYRDPSGVVDDRLAVNIMWDRRVVRGNTYAAQVLPAMYVPDPAPTQRSFGTGGRSSGRMAGSGRGSRRMASSFPHSSLTDDVTGGTGKHLEVNTEIFLEEITDRPIEFEVDTQTDVFMDRPPSPLFIPTKTGVDRETQILEGDLFNFDSEVEPILQVLVGKTLEQSLMEVMEEEELANMRAHQEEFDQIARAELAEAQRMEEAEKRRLQEKERRVHQERKRIAAEKEVALKVASRSFSHRYVGDVVADVFGTLNETGFFYDPLIAEIENVFTPWLLEGVASNAEALVRAAQLVEETVANAVKLQEERREASGREYEAMLAAIAKAKEEAERKAKEEAAAAAKAAEEAAAAEAAAEAEGGAEPAPA